MAENLEVLLGDCRAILPTLEAGSVQTCVTSPPYWGLRDYGTAQWEGGDEECEHIQERSLDSSRLRNDGRTHIGPYDGEKALSIGVPYRDICGKCGARRIDSQLGLEATPEEYIEKMVAVFREVWRVLRDDSTLWLNLGDSYAHGECGGKSPMDKRTYGIGGGNVRGRSTNGTMSAGLKPKDLCMMPARLAIALQADGWWVRSTIIWHKPNPMPESVTDRPTTSHEYIFLLTKQERYYYDSDAIREPQVESDRGNNGVECRGFTGNSGGLVSGRNSTLRGMDQNGAKRVYNPNGRNKRTVWTIATQPYAEAHFATFPEELPKLCILAGSKPGDLVMDPFAGSGTVGKVALELGRRAILIELNPAYIELARDRTLVTPGFF